MHPKQIAITDLNYHLPADKIALYPLNERDQSRLLIYQSGQIQEDVYRNISLYLPENSLLIFNNSKVIPARLLFTKPTGGVIELFCLEPVEQGEYSSAMNKTSPVQWKCMIGGAGKWKAGTLKKTALVQGNEVVLTAELQQKMPDAYVTRFSWAPSKYTFAEVIEQAGEVPLPPYIKRQTAAEDKERYQTIYALHQGSVAAPTAGLHFTNEILSSFKSKNITTDFITLHVGAGTFKPVKAAVMADHEMQAEWMEVTPATISNLLANTGKQVIAVGTTSLRMLESLYWMGVKAFLQPGADAQYLAIRQWEVYDLPLIAQSLQTTVALQSLLTWMKNNGREKLLITTQIIIAPGYRFKIVSALVTNFHQPNSTLLLVIAAAAGNDWKRMYAYALENNFRFLSYGDGSLIYFGING